LNQDMNRENSWSLSECLDVRGRLARIAGQQKPITQTSDDNVCINYNSKIVQFGCFKYFMQLSKSYEEQVLPVKDHGHLW
jgi:hypothetical protein